MKEKGKERFQRTTRQRCAAGPASTMVYSAHGGGVECGGEMVKTEREREREEGVCVHL